MNSQTQNIIFQGAAGDIEALIDYPTDDLFNKSKGTAVIAHPHPLFGGTMHNKVVQTIARACVQQGFTAVRFNFRGVGASSGEHDSGIGETQDMKLLVQQCAAHDEPLVIAGFSFGAFVASRAISEIYPARNIEKIVLVGTAAQRFEVPPIHQDLHAKTAVIHGQNDETVSLASVMQWATPQILPVTVVPSGGHFFHGQLPLLKYLVARHLC